MRQLHGTAFCERTGSHRGTSKQMTKDCPKGKLLEHRSFVVAALVLQVPWVSVEDDENTRVWGDMTGGRIDLKAASVGRGGTVATKRWRIIERHGDARTTPWRPERAIARCCVLSLPRTSEAALAKASSNLTEDAPNR